MRSQKLSLPDLAVIILCLLGFAVLSIPGFRFSAGILFGIALVIVCYRLLHLLGCSRPKAATILRRILTVCLCLLLAVSAVTGVWIIQSGFGNPEADCDYLIVLGAGVNGTVPSLSLKERLDAAYNYLQAHPDTLCIVSGGQGSGEEITEAACMFRYLTEAGIDPRRIIQEDKATSTRENLSFSLALMETPSQSRIGILSSEYHLCRAHLMAKAQGIDPVMIPAETTWLSLRMNYYLREVAGVWYYMIFGG